MVAPGPGTEIAHDRQFICFALLPRMVEATKYSEGGAISNSFSSCSATAEVLRGDRPAAMSSTGPPDSRSKLMGPCWETIEGGASRTTCPLDPPIPEPDMDINGFPDSGDGRGVGPVGTRRLYSSHLIAGFGVKRLTFGGIILCSKIEITFDNEAKNAVISVWLGYPHVSPATASETRQLTRYFP